MSRCRGVIKNKRIEDKVFRVSIDGMDGVYRIAFLMPENRMWGLLKVNVL
jgi:hypothetical protein